MINHYKVLNISETASKLEIKKAYRSLAVRYHPDKNYSEDSHKFIRIKEAYDILIDPVLRKKYDLELFKIRNPIRYTEEVTSKRFDDHNYDESVFSKVILFFIRAAVIIAIIYVGNYFLDLFFGKKNQHQIEEISKSNLHYEDSLKFEEQKIEKKLEKTKIKQYSNGDLKF